MKKLLSILFLVFILASSGNAQINWSSMGAESEGVANETLTWSKDVELNVRTLLSIGFQLETVNTSSFQGSLYIDKGYGTNYWQPAFAAENLTWTHTAGEVGTCFIYDIEDWNYKYVRARVIMSGDAQSIDITPYYKTSKGYR